MSKHLDDQLKESFERTAQHIQPPDAWTEIYQEIQRAEVEPNLQPKQRFSLKKILVTAFATLFLAFGVTAYALNPFQLLNPDGDVLITIEELTDPAPQGNGEITLDDIRDSLEPGQIAYVYFANDNPDGIITSMAQPYTYTDLTELNSVLGYEDTLPTQLPPGFSFSHGLVHIDLFAENCKQKTDGMYGCQVNPEDLIEEAELTGKDVIVKILDIELHQGNSVTYVFANEAQDTINFLSERFEWEEGRELKSYVPKEILDNMNKISINPTTEGFYYSHADNSTLMWLIPFGNTVYQYSLTSVDNATTLEEIILMANSVMSEQ